jgi:hypothetical protein
LSIIRMAVETVTCIIDAVIGHYDNQGNEGRGRQGQCDVADERT